MVLKTSRGPLTLAIHRSWAPFGVDRFYYLLRYRFYDDARFFRVVPRFVAQFGMPADPQFSKRFASTPIPDDLVRRSNLRGTVAFAHSGPGTRQNQLFINLKNNVRLDTLNGVGFAPIGEIRRGVELIDLLNGEYNAVGGPSQDSIDIAGNAYIMRVYPRLDYIQTARVVQEWR